MARKGYSTVQRAAKRESLLNAAVRIFENDGGIEAVSFRNVASVVGCSYSAPYRYFPGGKEELLTALRARAFRWIEQALRCAINPDDAPRVQLEALAWAYIKAGVQRPSLYALLFFQEDSEFAQRSIELKAAKHDALHACVEVIEAGQANKVLPDTTDALTATHMFWIGAHGLVSLEVGGQFVMGRSVEQLVPVLIQWLETGLEHHDHADLEPPGTQFGASSKVGPGGKP